LWATGEHSVHLGNLTMTVEGLAFQQQDLAVGACATAALWTALHRVTRYEGMRAPTPAEVSQAAGRHGMLFGRTLPAMAGLSVPQLCDAVRAVGFAPEVLNTAEPELFVVALHTYLLSGIPVVLVLGKPDTMRSLRSASVRRAGRHRLATHQCAARSTRSTSTTTGWARTIVPGTDTQTKKRGPAALLLGIEDERADERTQENPDASELTFWGIDSAIVPVYPKLRLSARSLITLAELVADSMEQVVGEAAASLSEMYYERAGAFSAGSQHAGIDVAAFVRRVALPRWCRRRWYLDDARLRRWSTTRRTSCVASLRS
jgi:hypothetical protein